MIASITQHGINLFRRKCLIFLTAITMGLAGCNSLPPVTPTVQVVTPTPAQVATPSATSPTSPIVLKTEEPQWLVYQGSNSYRGDLLFEIRYDGTQWKYSNEGPNGTSLRHLKIPRCILAWGGGDTVPNPVVIGTIQLAGRDWSIFKATDFALVYQSSPFGFGIDVLGNPTAEAMDACLQAAKEVLDSFKPLTQQVHLPSVVGATQAVDSSSIIDAEWPTYTSEKGGYSLRYPSDWVAREGIKGTVVITGPSGKWDDKITVIYYDFEKPETDDLAAWAKKLFELGLDPDYGRTFSSVSLAMKDPLGTSQQVYMQYAPSVPGEGYLITHGRLVLRISTDSADKNVTVLLRTIANSLVFADNAPTNQTQLSAPDQIPDYITIEAWQQTEYDSNLAVSAVNYRLETGEVATHLLAIMSDNARKDYDRLLVEAADNIAERDRQRASQASPTPLPTSNPTPNPTPNPGANSDEFFEQERVYNEGLTRYLYSDNA